jgi:hypothetical protein
MDTCREHTIIPAQTTGTEKNIERSVSIASAKQATQLYNDCKQRLLNVNDWDKIAEGLSAGFRLTDHAGQEVQRLAATGDRFRIDLPAPGNKAGDGYDWVLIELIEECGNPEEQVQSVAMRVRPCDNPLQPDNNIAHFLDEAATSSFIIERNGNNIVAGIYGRNEKPNISAEGLGDKLRNTVVAAGAIAGMANLQWEALAKGILQTGSQELAEADKSKD